MQITSSIMSSQGVMRMILSAPPKGERAKAAVIAKGGITPNKSAYACEMTCRENLEFLPHYGDLVLQIVVKTRGPMPKQISLRGRNGGFVGVGVAAVCPEWYLISFDAVGGLRCSGLDGQPVLGFPPENRTYINWAFVDQRSTTSLHAGTHLFPSQHMCGIKSLPAQNLPLAHTERMMTMPHVTSVSWGKTQLPVKLDIHGVTVFEIKDEDHRKAMEIISRGAPTYKLGSGFYPKRAGSNEAELTVAGARKQVCALPSRL